MQCPTDGTVLVMSERSGIEIDYCPTCRGVWLDRGELDKIIERSEQSAPATARPDPYEQERDQRRADHDRRYSQPERYAAHQRPKRKESWLSDLFD